MKKASSPSKLESSKSALWDLMKESQAITTDDERYLEFQESRGALLKKMLLEQNLN